MGQATYVGTPGTQLRLPGTELRLVALGEGWWELRNEQRSEVLLGTERRGDSNFVVTVVAPEGQALDARLLRNLPLRQIEARLNRDPLAASQAAATGPCSPKQRNREVYQRVRGKTSSSPWKDRDLDAVIERHPLRKPAQPVSPEFWREVAETYRILVQTTSRPAAEMARMADVPLRTAQGWIAQARRKGVLEPGQSGRAV